jgi:hypothetical protein
MILELFYRLLAEPWERIPVNVDLRVAHPAKVRHRDLGCPLHSGHVIWGSGMPCLCGTDYTMIDGKKLSGSR